MGNTIKDVMSGLSGLPILGGIFGGISTGMQRDEDQAALDEQRGRFDGIDLPRFGGSYKPEDLALQQYGRPEDAQYQLANVDPEMRGLQMQALQNLQGIANGSADAGLAAAQYQATDQANRLARSREGAIQQDMMMRGAGGGGMESVLRAQSAQEGANRAASSGLNAAAAAALQRLQGMGMYQQGLGSVRGQDAQQAQYNADVINRFNMANTGMRNQVAMGNTDIANRGAVANNAAHNGAQQYNLNRNDSNAMNTYNATMGREGARAGMTTGMVQNAGNANNSILAQGANMRGEITGAAMAAAGGGFGGGAPDYRSLEQEKTAGNSIRKRL